MAFDEGQAQGHSRTFLHLSGSHSYFVLAVFWVIVVLKGKYLTLLSRIQDYSPSGFSNNLELRSASFAWFWPTLSCRWMGKKNKQKNIRGHCPDAWFPPDVIGVHAKDFSFGFLSPLNLRNEATLTFGWRAADVIILFAGFSIYILVMFLIKSPAPCLFMLAGLQLCVESRRFAQMDTDIFHSVRWPEGLQDFNSASFLIKNSVGFQ